MGESGAVGDEPPGDEQPADKRASTGSQLTPWAFLLLLTVPLAGFAAFILYVIAAVSVCGISGCSGGGYGVSYSPDYEWILPLLLAGALMTVAIAGPPWSRQHKRRWLIVSLVFGILVAAQIVIFALSKYA